MSRAARRAAGASRWEIERDIQIAEARRTYDEQRARDREALRQRALDSARKYGADDRWRVYWSLVGLTAEELSAVRTEAILGESS